MNASSVTAAAADAYKPGGPIENATCVVTGANRGIGLEFVKQLLGKHEGNAVVAGCRDPTKAEALMELQLKVGAARLAVTRLDVSDESSVGVWAANMRTLDAVVTNGGNIDVVINNAGTTGTDGYSKWDLQDTDAEGMMHVFKINTVGPLLVVQQLLKNNLIGVAGADATDAKSAKSAKVGKSQGKPCLVGNVTSKVGSVDDNGGGKGYAYRASKAALNMVNKSLSIDLLDREIESVLLHPGWVRTRMTQDRGLVETDESVGGMIKAMELTFGEVNGKWYDYKGDEIPW